MSEVAGGFCITCPRCGQVHQRGFATDSIIVCMACGYQFYAYLNRGMLIEAPASQIAEEAFLSRMRDFVLDVGKEPASASYEHGNKDYVTCLREVRSAYGTGRDSPDDNQLLSTIRKITKRGNDAEIRRRTDGTLAVYEIKKNIAI